MSAEIHVIDLLPAYTLSCLEEEEARQVADHLATCASCYAEFMTYQVVVDDLALVPPAQRPPASVKSRLIAQIQSAPEELPAPARPTWWQNRFANRQGWGGVWQVLVPVMILALVVSSLLLWQRVRALSSVLPGDMFSITLMGTSAMPDADGVIILSTTSGRGMLIVDGLPPLDAEHDYQVWLERNGTPASLGTLSTYDRGYGWLEIISPDGLFEDNPSVTVTIEPAGGSTNPSDSLVLSSAHP